MSLRGFGMTFDLQRGSIRRWYAGEDGVQRWADNDQPVDTPTPDAPEPYTNPAQVPEGEE